jgi:hypothetical protein
MRPSLACVLPTDVEPLTVARDALVHVAEHGVLAFKVHPAGEGADGALPRLPALSMVPKKGSTKMT